MTETGASVAWRRDVQSAFFWGGAATGSLGSTAVYALTGWFMAILCVGLYLIGAVITYRRAFVKPLRETAPHACPRPESGAGR